MSDLFFTSEVFAVGGSVAAAAAAAAVAASAASCTWRRE